MPEAFHNLVYLFEYRTPLSWPTIKSILQNKVSASSYFWLAFTPTAATLLRHSNETVSIGGLTLSLSLPFSWVIFFFAALCFSLATTIYRLKCPELIKGFSNFSEVEKAQVTARQLLFIIADDADTSKGAADPLFADAIMELISGDDYAEVLNEAQSRRKVVMREQNRWLTTLPLNDYIASNPGKFPLTDAKLENNNAELYWLGSSILATEHNRPWRSVVSLVIFLGFALLLVVLIQSIISVIEIGILEKIGR
jgi:hypothetical protein